MINLVIFGGPGSGKGTQSDLMIEEYGLFQVRAEEPDPAAGDEADGHAVLLCLEGEAV